MRVRVLGLGVLANLAISVRAFAVGRNSLQVRGPVASTSAPPLSSPTGDAWKTMQCSQIHGSPADQWQQAGAKSAWDTTIAAWKVTPGANSFPLFVSNHTDGPDGMRCSDMSSENRCAQPVQCEDAIPAVAMILNGFTGIHQLHASVFQAIGLAQASVTNNVGTFTSAFAPQRKDNSANIRMIIDAAMLVVSFGTSILYNVVLQSAVNIIGKAIAQDMTGTILATAVTYYKTNMKGALEGLAEQNTIDTFVGKTMDEWKKAETSYLSSIFAGGDPSAIDALYATINNGTIAAAMDRLDLARTSIDVEKILYGQMISYAWTVSGDRVRPFIWRSSEYCDETTMPLSKGRFVESTSFSKIYVCHNNRMHLLLNAHQHKGTGFSSETLPGGDHNTLNGVDYGGITIDDIVISSVDGWSKNNYQNGYPKADVDSVVASFGGDNAPSVRSPGFFNLPICLNSNAAEDNIRYGWNKESPYWPCENPEGYTSTGTDIRVRKGCVLFNDAKRCQTWGGPYNVADQNTPNSTVTIYAMFKGTSEKLVDKEVPGCKLVGSWPRDWPEMHFSEDNCLEDENGYYRQCCSEDTKTTDLVNNPYGPSW